ncbi:cytochrome P450 CYP736A12-like [Glycine soja]|uniref:cytochrome P450 CYP736A12-like n=1 Tax=Glycine soja TaxID=3848 RepID=UPI00103B4048|nr:cytochrome P450 CYP736A12-like [Glycine soja]
MLPQTLAIPALLFVVFIFILSAVVLQSKQNEKYPPGPKTLPIIGNLHMLGKLPHRTLQSLAKQYGPIMSLKLGQVTTIVISSPETAELFLKTHDTTFASRPKSISSKYISYGGKGLVFSEYGPYWRNMRKLCTVQLLIASKVEMFSPLRSQQLQELVKCLRKTASSREVVDLSDMVGDLIENINFQMIFGCSKDDRFDVKNLAHEIVNLAGTFNVADYMPWLRVFDLQELVRRLKKVSKSFDEVLEQIIKDHEQSSDNKQKSQRQKDFVDIFLALMHQPLDPQDEHGHVLDRTNMKAIMMTMIVAAIDTSATAIEWAMSELLKHPRVMKKLQDELESVVGMNRKVEESDMEKLPYLDLVVKETLRLYPVAPLLVPRECREEITIDGYCIKERSRIIVNAWAIGRDPKVWSDNAEVFYPERFANSNVDMRGYDFRLLPFGSGRRGCPGIHLGLTTVKIVLAQLVHCFNWELPLGMSPDDLDMTEKFGLTIPRSNHLLAVPTYRLAGPPGPPRLPIIGNLHMVGGAGTLPHRSLQSLSKRYGPIMSLQLGNVPTVVVSSPEAAELFLKTHDTVFANRPKFETAQYTYGAESVAFAEYGPYWRNVRKVCTTHLLSASKVESFDGLRKREIGAMVESLKEAAMAREVVDVSERVGEVLRDMACKMVLGRNKDDRFDLKGILVETMSVSGAFNLADYVPWLRLFDLQGLTRRSKKISKSLDKMLDEMIEEHQLAPPAQGHLKDFIDILLSLKDQPIHPHDKHAPIIDKRSIKGIVFDMIIGASETSSNVIEWAISELVRHPRVMENLQNELKDVVGINKMVDENDLAKLSYLDMVVKETLRLHPVVPLLAPHESMEDIVIEGYYIKKKSRVIINAWAIGRDPKVWSENAEVFYPERFMNSNIDFKGQDFQLIPFGSGRRSCPGIVMGLTTVKLVLTQLVHCFKWELPCGIGPDELDMNEKSGLSMPRARHLLVIPTYRLLHETLGN